jgi:type II secretory pathway component PulF
MAIFTYKAKDLEGEVHTGDIEVADQHAATSILRKKGLVVISVNPKAESKLNFIDQFVNRVSFSSLVTFTRQLATMINAGLTLSEAIDILYQQEENKKFKAALEEVSHDIKGGLTLNQAFARHREIFPTLYINLVKAGEASGKLDEVLSKMADSLESDREFRARIKGAMIYPAVVLTMMLVVMVIMIVFVIPRLTDLYKESSLELPLPTKILIGISDAFLNFWWLIILVIIASVIAFKKWVKTPEGSLAFDKLLLKIPVVGRVITNVTLTNFNRTFGLLTAAGIPLLDAIGIVESITGNKVFKNALRTAYTGVERGLTLSAQLILLPVFPPIVGQMVRVGEETGKVDEIFYKLAEYFEQESDHLVKNLTVAIEPLVLIILGIGVAFLVTSIILPIYKLTASF